MKTNNKTDKLLHNITELEQEPLYEDFAQSNLFAPLCKVTPNQQEEKLNITWESNSEDMNRVGLDYLIVVNDRIFKLGHSTTNIKKRIQSYNCGKKAYRENGTCSTTNYYVLQSLLNMNKEATFYAFFPPVPPMGYELFGVTYTDGVAPAKRAEGILIEAFTQQFNKKPIGCVQK
jgi:hypothetical protein